MSFVDEGGAAERLASLAVAAALPALLALDLTTGLVVAVGAVAAAIVSSVAFPVLCFLDLVAEAPALVGNIIGLVLFANEDCTVSVASSRGVAEILDLLEICGFTAASYVLLGNPLGKIS